MSTAAADAVANLRGMRSTSSAPRSERRTWLLSSRNRRRVRQQGAVWTTSSVRSTFLLLMVSTLFSIYYEIRSMGSSTMGQFVVIEPRATQIQQPRSSPDENYYHHNSGDNKRGNTRQSRRQQQQQQQLQEPPFSAGPEGPHVDDNTTKPFCVSWDVDTDAWWTHHPDWSVTAENATHYCFDLMRDPAKAQFFRQLYNLQFPTNCSDSVTMEMISQGFGSDYRSVYQGLTYALDHQRTVVMYLPFPWIYAVGPQTWINGTRQFISPRAARTAACPEKNAECYFLNLTHCPADPNHAQPAYTYAAPSMDNAKGGWILEYALRPQTWLRKRVYQYRSTVQMERPCTVFHVRRADAALVIQKNDMTRRYHAMEEYVNAAAAAGVNASSRHNFLLLTDDANAIREALHKYPDHHWMYLDRPRHKGPEGGFENQIPSGDPITEVVVILSELALAQHCDSIVHTFSSFSYLLRAMMMSVHGDNTRITAIDMDDPLHETNQVFTATNKHSVNLSKSYE